MHFIATPTLRHSLILNFEAEAEGMTTDHIVTSIFKEVPMDGENIVASR